MSLFSPSVFSANRCWPIRSVCLFDLGSLELGWSVEVALEQNAFLIWGGEQAIDLPFLCGGCCGEMGLIGVLCVYDERLLLDLTKPFPEELSRDLRVEAVFSVEEILQRLSGGGRGGLSYSGDERRNCPVCGWILNADNSCPLCEYLRQKKRLGGREG